MKTEVSKTVKDMWKIVDKVERAGKPQEKHSYCPFPFCCKKPNRFCFVHNKFDEKPQEKCKCHVGFGSPNIKFTAVDCPIHGYKSTHQVKERKEKLDSVISDIFYPFKYR